MYNKIKKPRHYMYGYCVPYTPEATHDHYASFVTLTCFSLSAGHFMLATPLVLCHTLDTLFTTCRPCTYKISPVGHKRRNCTCICILFNYTHTPGPRYVLIPLVHIGSLFGLLTEADSGYVKQAYPDVLWPPSPVVTLMEDPPPVPFRVTKEVLQPHHLLVREIVCVRDGGKGDSVWEEVVRVWERRENTHR